MNGSSALSRIPLYWLVLLCAVALWPSLHAAAQEAKKAAAAEKSPDVSHLLKRYQRASQEDDRRAKQALDIAEKEAARENWSGALKAFGESISRKPSVKALLGEALAISRTSKEGQSCREEIAAQFKSFEAAVKRLGEAVAFRQALGPKSDVDDRTITQYQKKILDTQKMLFEKQQQCLEPQQKDSLKQRKLQSK